jgi:hypothetical protein
MELVPLSEHNTSNIKPHIIPALSFIGADMNTMDVTITITIIIIIMTASVV